MFGTIRGPHPRLDAIKRTIRRLRPYHIGIPGGIGVRVIQNADAHVFLAAIGTEFRGITFQACVDAVTVRRISKRGIFIPAFLYREQRTIGRVGKALLRRNLKAVIRTL